MKKNVLLAAMIAATLSVSAQQKDITPKAYQFANRAVGEQLQVQDEVGDWNTPPMSSDQIKSFAPEGGFISANMCTKADVMNASCIVDLGGNVGHVLAITGTSMEGLNEAYAAAGLGEVKNAPQGKIGQMQLNIYSDPETTPGASVIQSDFVVNAWSPNLGASQHVWKNFYYMTSDNSVNPNGSNAWKANGLDITDFCKVDEAGDLETDDFDNPIYDPNRWMRLTTYVGTLGEGGKYSNAIKAKLWTGGFGNVVLFIKEISFKTTDLTTDSEEFKSQDNHKRTVETYNPDPNKVTAAIQNIQAAKNFSIANGTFTSPVAADVYTLEGKKVFSGTQGKLTPGVYVAKINNVSVKFVVK